jgi:methylglutaconyl-CoA hydratase
MDLVRVQTADGVATVTLDSPDNRNALSSAVIDGLIAAMEASAVDERVRVVVLTHAGPAFCSGADLRETAAAFATGQVPASRMGLALAAVWDCPKPVVARVGGPARAGGLGLVAAADIAICTTEATFAFSEVRLGVIPAVISATVLPRLAPRAANELFLTGDTFGGARAAEVGLVTRAVAAADLDAEVARAVDALKRGAPAALAAAKALVRRSGRPVREELAELTEVSVRFFTSDEGREGVRAFLEKRDPVWARMPGVAPST